MVQAKTGETLPGNSLLDINLPPFDAIIITTWFHVSGYLTGILPFAQSSL